VFIEEAFERMLLDYDRVFSAMGVPACLWRRTGEIYKGNREFTELVGVDGYMMRDVSDDLNTLLSFRFLRLHGIAILFLVSTQTMVLIPSTGPSLYLRTHGRGICG
jgi:hypothetical protein